MSTENGLLTPRARRRKYTKSPKAEEGKSMFDRIERERIAIEKEVENKILVILKEEYDSLEEGRYSLPLDVLFGDISCSIPEITLKEFTDALNRLSGDGLFRSKKRIRIEFMPNPYDWARDSRRKPKVEVAISFLENSSNPI